MFSIAEKQKIADGIERLLLELAHPEMPKERPVFELHVKGKESWSWADIKPNWEHEATPSSLINPWNEVARERMLSEK